MNPVGESRKNDCCIVVKGLMCIQPPACKSLLGRVYVLMIHDEENQVRIRYKTSSRTPLLRSFSSFFLPSCFSFFLSSLLGKASLCQQI